MVIYVPEIYKKLHAEEFAKLIRDFRVKFSDETFEVFQSKWADTAWGTVTANDFIEEVHKIYTESK